jgi:TRAP-type mannitol/chloroaromatic compound transport system permease large subunit
MLDLIAHNLAPIMFVTVMAMLLIGYPVAFTLAAGGMYFFVVGVELSHISPEIRLFWPLAQANMNRVFDIMRNDTLLAIPFFTFMGLILERSRMAEDLLDTIGQLFGTLRGGLAFAVVVVGALLAATTGVVAASVIAMGLISLPIMMRYNYHPGLAAGTIAASGTLAQIIPPSLVLIVMADQLGRSVGDMYVGAFFPALIIVGMYCAYIFAITLIKPSWVPALPPEARPLGDGGRSLYVIIGLAIALFFVCDYFVFDHLRYETRVVWSALVATMIPYAFALLNRSMNLGYLSKMAEQVVIVLIPPLALIFLVLGTIFLGIATPTEGGAMGATGALIMSLMKGRLDRKTLLQALDSTAKLATFVMFILIGARVFALTFYGISGDRWVEELLLALPGGEVGFLITVSIVVFILGCFLDFFEIAFIMVPLAGAGGREAGDRPDLVRCPARLQPAGQLPDATLRLRTVLSAVGGANQSLVRQDHRPHDRTDFDQGDLHRHLAVHRDPDRHAGYPDCLPRACDTLQDRTGDHEPGRHQRGDQQHRRRRIWPAGLGSQP